MVCIEHFVILPSGLDRGICSLSRSQDLFRRHLINRNSGSLPLNWLLNIKCRPLLNMQMNYYPQLIMTDHRSSISTIYMPMLYLIFHFGSAVTWRS